MALRVEIAGTDRSSDLRGALTLDRSLNAAGAARFLVHSLDASWRPALLDWLDIWEPCSVYTDAAINSGSTTLTSATASFTADSVGQHVRIADAVAAGTPLRAVITVFTNSTTVTISQAASATVSGKQLLLGTARFLGVVFDFTEQRVGNLSDTRAFDVQGADLMRVCDYICPYGTHNVDSELKSRVQWLATTGSVIDTHQVYVYWPDADVGIISWPAQYSLDKTLTTVMNDLIAEEGTNRNWQIDPLGRLWVSEWDARPSGITLSEANDNVLVVTPPQYEQSASAYANRVWISGTASCSTAEQDALGGRIFEYYTATGDGAALLATKADRTPYTATLLTRTRLDVGETVTVTIPDHSMSGTHVVQGVRATYPNAVTGWSYELTVTNATAAQETWRKWWQT